MGKRGIRRSCPAHLEQSRGFEKLLRYYKEAVVPSRGREVFAYLRCVKRALFPGSFDPITNGHIEIIRRGLVLFDEIVVGIGLNTSKQPMFPPEQRLRWIEEAFHDEPRVQVRAYAGLTVRFAREIGAQFILRGLRSAPDYEYERNIDLLNKYLDAEIETFYLLSSPETSFVSSTLVREVIRFHGHLEGLLPPHIIRDIYATYPEGKPIGA